MGKQYGSAYSGSDPLHLAPGQMVDAAVRRFRNTFTLATQGGGTADTPVVAKIREGNAIEGFKLSSSVDLSGLTFTLGTASAPAKYATDFAGPAANKTVEAPILAAMLAADALATPEELILTPSGNMPAAGTVVTSVFTSKR